MTPRRVLMTADAVGGVWTYALELARGLSRCGVAVQLAVMGRPPSAGQREAAAAVPGLRLAEAPWKLEWEADCEADLDASADWLLSLERELQPDLVHVNGYWHASLPWRAPCVCVAHSCVNTWWRAVHGEPAPKAWDAYTARVREGLAKTDLVIAPTAAFLDALAAVYGAPRDARTIWNGRDGDGRRGEKLPCILAAGRVWDRAKNLAAVAAVAPRLDWPVWIAGEGGEGAVAANVRRLGLLEPQAMADALARASIFALPARYEPFGLGPLEAALAGCALVLGDIPSLRELWDGAAVFVAPDEPAELEAALRSLIADPDKLRAAAEAAQRRAARYSVARMTARYLEACDGVLDGAAPLRRAS
jgi:glycosyltransferase involved in cell wall biosynthesis